LRLLEIYFMIISNTISNGFTEAKEIIEPEYIYMFLPKINYSIKINKNVLIIYFFVNFILDTRAIFLLLAFALSF